MNVRCCVGWQGGFQGGGDGGEAGGVPPQPARGGGARQAQEQRRPEVPRHRQGEDRSHAADQVLQ
jgi:hypothetical protein